MGKELPMARKERGRRQVLLAGAGSGEPIDASSSRKKRKEEDGTPKGEASKPSVNSTQESKSSPEAKAPDDAANKAKGHRRGHKARKSTGEHEGGDCSTRRRAKELGVNWPDDRCWESPTHAHWFTASSEICRGYIWICKYCLKAKWMPDGWPDNERFARSIIKYGIDEAYWKWIDRRPTVVVLLRKLEDLRLMRKVVMPDDYAKVVAAIMSDRDYPYEENKKP